MKILKFSLVVLFWVVMMALCIAERSYAQEVKHPDMELSEDENGQPVVVVVATQKTPDPKLYTVKEEQAGDKTIYVVYYKPTGETISFFTKSTIKGKVEGPGVSLFNRRVAPEIEKVVGQKSYDKEIKRRYLDLVFIDKADFLNTQSVDLKEIDKILKKRRN
jgi:hypothetical protein